MYLMSIEGMGDGSGNFADYFSPVIAVYDSLEKLYKAFDDECKHHDEGISRIKFVEYFNAGGVIFNEYSWIKITNFKLNEYTTLGDSYDRDKLKPNKPIFYKHKEYEFLETHKELIQCLYVDLDMDEKEFACEQKVSKNGYCSEHNVIRDNIMNEIEERFQRIARKLKSSEEEHDKFITYWEEIDGNNYTLEHLKYLEDWEEKLEFDYEKYKASRDEIKLVTKENLDVVPFSVLKIFCDLDSILNFPIERYFEHMEEYQDNLVYYMKNNLKIFYLYRNYRNILKYDSVKKIIALRNDEIVYDYTRDEKRVYDDVQEKYILKDESIIIGSEDEVLEILKIQNLM